MPSGQEKVSNVLALHRLHPDVGPALSMASEDRKSKQIFFSSFSHHEPSRFSFFSPLLIGIEKVGAAFDYFGKYGPSTAPDKRGERKLSVCSQILFLSLLLVSTSGERAHRAGSLRCELQEASTACCANTLRENPVVRKSSVGQPAPSPPVLGIQRYAAP